MGRAQEQYDKAIKKHIAFCAKKGEDPLQGAHIEWSLALGKLYDESYGRAEEKMEAIRVANEPPKITDALKLTNAKMEWTVAESLLKVDVDGLITALDTEQIGVESHKSLEESREKLEKDLESLKALNKRILELAAIMNVPEEEVTILRNDFVNLMKSTAPKIRQIKNSLIIKKPDVVEQTNRNPGVDPHSVSRRSIA